MSFEFLDHTGDTAVRLRATSGEELFREAMRAVLAIYCGVEGSERVGRDVSLAVCLEAEDGETLLVDFLNEIVYLFDSRRFLAAELEVSRLELEPAARLEGVLKGEMADASRHTLQTEIKAATFHDLEIREQGGEVRADVVFDL